MNTKKMFAMLLLVLVMVVGLVSAAEDKKPKPIVLKDEAKIEATVEAIDTSARALTLKGPKGKVVTLAVDESVTRFDQIKVGDKVKVRYHESVLVEVRKPGSEPLEASVAAAVAPKEGAKPAGVAVVQETMTVTIEAIDPEVPAVTVRTVDGNSLSFRVQKKKNLKNVNVGDMVVVTRTAGVAIDVTADN
jgi:hypothetical protein